MYYSVQSKHFKHKLFIRKVLLINNIQCIFTGSKFKFDMNNKRKQSNGKKLMPSAKLNPKTINPVIFFF